MPPASFLRVAPYKCDDVTQRCLCLREGDKRSGAFDDGAAESFRLGKATLRSWVPAGRVVGLHANEGKYLPVSEYLCGAFSWPTSKALEHGW